MDKKTVLFILLGLTVLNIHAQKSIVASGGDTQNSMGSFSFSLGQIACITIKDSGGSIEQGIQQPYEIILINGIKDDKLLVSVSVYPNPVTTQLIIDTEVNDFKRLFFNITDLNGKEIIKGKISESKTVIPMESSSSEMYILNITERNKIIKSYKIIKK